MGRYDQSLAGLVKQLDLVRDEISAGRKFLATYRALNAHENEETEQSFLVALHVYAAAIAAKVE